VLCGSPAQDTTPEREAWPERHHVVIVSATTIAFNQLILITPSDKRHQIRFPRGVPQILI
jgi:hypothetical protein